MQRHSHGEDEREHFEPVEGPAEVRGEQRLPLRAVKRAIPGRRGGGGEVARGLAHKCLPDFCAAAPGGRSLAKTLRRDRAELEGWERWAYRAFVKNALAAYSVGSPPPCGEVAGRVRGVQRHSTRTALQIRQDMFAEQFDGAHGVGGEAHG